MLSNRRRLRQWSLDVSREFDLVLLGKFPCPLEDSDLVLLVANRGRLRQWSLDDSGEIDLVLLGKFPCLLEDSDLPCPADCKPGKNSPVVP